VDERRRRVSRDKLLAQTLPGWLCLALLAWLVLTHDSPSVDIVATLLAGATVFLGGPAIRARLGR
jgi:hypothetical protein